MKKNLQTLLTAAAFAVSAGGAFASNVNADAASEMPSIPLFDDEYRPERDEAYGVYGPAPAWTQHPRGDVNLDNVIDVFDLIKLKEMLLNANTKYDRLIDLNDDDEFNIADVVMMGNYLTGRTAKYELTDEQKTVTTSLTAEDIITTTTYEAMVLYGPPWMFTETTATTADIETLVTYVTTTTTVLYAPPPMPTATTAILHTPDISQYINTTESTEVEKLITTTTTSTPVTTYGPPAFFFRTSDMEADVFYSPIKTTETTAVPQE